MTSDSDFKNVARNVYVEGGLHGVQVSSDAGPTYIDGLTVIGSEGAALSFGGPLPVIEEANASESPPEASFWHQHIVAGLIGLVVTVAGGVAIYLLGMN